MVNHKYKNTNTVQTFYIKKNEVSTPMNPYANDWGPKITNSRCMKNYIIVNETTGLVNPYFLCLL